MARVSVLIPVYNGAEYIGQALESVLQQSYQDFEIIVVDDGSTDDLAAALRPYREAIHFITQANQGLAAARNTALAAASGELIAFLDCDDRYLPDKLAVQTRYLDQHPETGLVAGGLAYIDEQGNFLQNERPWEVHPDITLESLLRHGLTVANSVLIRRAWCEAVQGFDPALRIAEDMDFWYRLSLACCRFDWQPEIVCEYRIHTHNLSRSPKKHFEAHFAVLERVFQRPDLPAGLQAQKNEIFSAIRLAEAGRLYGAGCLEDARQALVQAVRLDPAGFEQAPGRIVEAVVDWQKNLWNRGSPNFLDQVFAAWPAEIPLSEPQRRAIRLNCLKAAFYTAYDDRQAGAVQQAWKRIAAQEAGWWLNRGGWSILFQSFRWDRNP